MNTIVWLYATLTAVSRRIENWRVVLLAHVWGMANGEKMPVAWRIREKIPSSDNWPTVKVKEDQPAHRVWLRGAVRVGPIRPVPAPPDFYKENK